MNWRRLEKGKKQIIGILAAIMLLVIGLIWFVPMDAGVSLRVEYAREYENDFHAQLFWMTDDNYAEEKSSYIQVKQNRAELEVREAMDRIQELRFDPTNEQEETAITSIQIRKYGIGVMEIPVRELMERAQFLFMEQPEVTRGVLSIVPQSDDSAIVLGQDIIEDYFAPCQRKFKVIATVWMVLAAIVLWLAVIYSEYLKKAAAFILEKYDTITRVILLVALFLVGYMAFNSFDYAHPDENMSKAAVDYYVEHWKPADIRSPEVADTFSAYGHSRLKEVTAYYFLAGKVAWFAKNILGLEQYYRAFNVLLFAIMVGIYCKKGKKNAYLFLMLGLTPQIWYLFSYTTSDAWDYFLSFLVLYQLTVETSLFRRALEHGLSKWKGCWLVMVGALYGLLLLGKKNYYFVFAASFFWLLYWWIKSENKKKMQMAWKYVIVLAVCLSIYGGAKYSDNIRYDNQKGEIAAELKTQYEEVSEGANQKETDSGIWAGNRMKSRGITLNEIFSKYGFAKYSYQSYAGTYGWMEYESTSGYYILIGILYVLILVELCSSAISDGYLGDKVLFGLLLVLSVAVFGSSVWHSWTSDFQPQGRYLFSINFIAAIAGCLYQRSFMKRSTVKIALCLVGIMSIYSFVFNGIFHLV